MTLRVLFLGMVVVTVRFRKLSFDLVLPRQSKLLISFICNLVPRVSLLPAPKIAL